MFLKKGRRRKKGEREEDKEEVVEEELNTLASTFPRVFKTDPGFNLCDLQKDPCSHRPHK